MGQVRLLWTNLGGASIFRFRKKLNPTLQIKNRKILDRYGIFKKKSKPPQKICVFVFHLQGAICSVVGLLSALVCSWAREGMKSWWIFNQITAAQNAVEGTAVCVLGEQCTNTYLSGHRWSVHYINVVRPYCTGSLYKDILLFSKHFLHRDCAIIYFCKTRLMQIGFILCKSRIFHLKLSLFLTPQDFYIHFFFAS